MTTRVRCTTTFHFDAIYRRTVRRTDFGSFFDVKTTTLYSAFALTLYGFANNIRRHTNFCAENKFMRMPLYRLSVYVHCVIHTVHGDTLDGKGIATKQKKTDKL